MDDGSWDMRVLHQIDVLERKLARARKLADALEKSLTLGSGRSEKEYIEDLGNVQNALCAFREIDK